MKGKIAIIVTVLFLLFVAAITTHFFLRYKKNETMVIPIEELTTTQYPEDPSHRSIYYNKYDHRILNLQQKNSTHFDLVFESKDKAVATVIFRDLDLSLLIPAAPEWIREDSDLEVISLVDREWNRQQVVFTPKSSHLEVIGGDGFEKRHLFTAEIARNNLNAGLWELLLFTKENGKKALYYHGWFTFPLGHYKDLFQALNESSYWKHWYRLEHWFDPSRKYVDLDKLRKINDEVIVETKRNGNDRIVVSGEQIRKTRTMSAPGVRCWDDFCQPNNVYFASFVPPGRYNVKTPWSHQYNRITHLDKTVIRRVNCSNGDDDLHEIELVFTNPKDGMLQKFIVGGIDLKELPQLPVPKYPKGLYMPMGIGVSPIFQTYEELESNPPYHSPYYCLLIDKDNRWVNHRRVAIDGPVMHLDERDPNLLHLYLLSYERHTLVGHFVIPLNQVVL